jgi:hypothetical protein
MWASAARCLARVPIPAGREDNRSRSGRRKARPALPDSIKRIALQIPDELLTDDLVQIARLQRLPLTDIRDHIIDHVQTELVWTYYHDDLASTDRSREDV